MNLIIDVGNTSVKLAVFQKGTIICKEVVDIDKIEVKIQELKNKHPLLSKAIISSVGNLSQSQLVNITKHIKTIVLNHNVKVPFKNKYKTPGTLGVDRIALVSAAVLKHPKKNVLIIDAGTCVTYDFINSKNEYLGGAISPGISIRYKSLNNLTANLPLLKRKAPKKLIGNSSIESIHSGIINGILMEIDGIINKYQKKYKDLTVILTGGDSDFLSKRLKSSIFANSNFLLEGLNFILEFNSNE
ncbi:type III pantothenate kinase [Pontimicrobium aquaticum]|uniref:Type III pantothenate kinase n=1 Tax=Pontimicrobium aquaticum TaxID=2565367 RepID=A0A4U0F0E5_9FLAO|nr:type III pantothenate kinase [Pontimicrobium aquaticum]TJY37690.1 type III pantothenate kinase [Pontimicrobium aquaticum]